MKDTGRNVTLTFAEAIHKDADGTATSPNTDLKPAS